MSRRLLAAGTAGAALLLVLGLAVPVWPAVTVSTEGDRLAVLDTETVTISYVHSIDGLPIEEDLRASDEELIVERTRLRQFGAGMGHIEGEGKGHSQGKWWVVDDMERRIGPDLHLRVGAPTVDHRLRSGDVELALSQCLAGERVTLTAERVSTLTMATAPTQLECT